MLLVSFPCLYVYHWTKQIIKTEVPISTKKKKKSNRLVLHCSTNHGKIPISLLHTRVLRTVLQSTFQRGRVLFSKHKSKLQTNALLLSEYRRNRHQILYHEIHIAITKLLIQGKTKINNYLDKKKK